MKFAEFAYLKQQKESNQLQILNFSLVNTAYKMLPEDEFAEFFAGIDALKNAWQAGVRGWNHINPVADVPFSEKIRFTTQMGFDNLMHNSHNFYRPYTGILKDITPKNAFYRLRTNTRTNNPFVDPISKKLRWGNIAGVGVIGAGGIGIYNNNNKIYNNKTNLQNNSFKDPNSYINKYR